MEFIILSVIKSMKQHWDDTSQHTATGHKSLVKTIMNILVTHWRVGVWETPELRLLVELKGEGEKGYLCVISHIACQCIVGIVWGAKNTFCDRSLA